MGIYAMSEYKAGTIRLRADRQFAGRIGRLVPSSTGSATVRNRIGTNFPQTRQLRVRKAFAMLRQLMELLAPHERETEPYSTELAATDGAAS